MYFIIELQKQDETSVPDIVHTAQTYNEAESVYHTVLAAAAISPVPVHSALVIDDEGHPVHEPQSYRHESGEEE